MKMIQVNEYLVSKGQLSKIHVLLGQLPPMDKKEMTKYKRELVRDYTDGRETSMAKLTWKEANQVIASLERLNGGNKASRPDPVARVPTKPGSGTVADKKRKKLLHYCHLMNWYEGQPMEISSQLRSVGDLARQAGQQPPPQRKLDMVRVDGWCVNYGKYKKPLMKHSASELSVLITQMERVYKDHLNVV